MPVTMFSAIEGSSRTTAMRPIWKMMNETLHTTRIRALKRSSRYS